MSTALVTGAAGFVGRHFTKHLRLHGWTVRGVDILPGDGVNTVDARDWFRFDPASYDLVLHCAAVVGGRHVIDNDPLAQAVNLELDAALFRWARKARPGRVIYFSSPAAYPVRLQTAQRRYRLDEHDIMFTETVGMPDQMYGWAKLAGEFLARKAQEDGLAVSVVRPFSGYGEDQDDCYPFPAFIDRALRREDPFLVWGTGDQARDWIHVDDIVAAVMRMYEREINGPANLGFGRPLSVRGLAMKVCELAGYTPQLEFAPSAPSGVDFRVASVTRMYSFYGPRISIEQGISRALKYRAERCPIS